MLSGRQRHSNYTEPSKENVLGEYDPVTMAILYLKVLHDMLLQILKLIFQTQPSCHRNICTEGRKLPNLTAFLEIFLYIKNNDSVEHM